MTPPRAPSPADPARPAEGFPKPTPGPWFVDSQNGQCVVAGDDDGPIVAMCMAEDLGDGMAFGNAALIAAAPSLLAACQAALAALDGDENVSRWADATSVRVALRQALALAAPGPKGGGA